MKRLDNGCFKSKRLLVLGASTSEIPLVIRAQELGCEVTVTDYNTDWSLSPAKQIADKAWDISWSDISLLAEKCREERIDGVVAGYSEIRVEYLISLCETLNLPCYCTSEQLEVTRNKTAFKEVCRSYGVPVVREYDAEGEDLAFPVIVKPVDRGGSLGISVAYNESDYAESLDIARNASLSGEVIVEQYITEATKFDALYAINDGRVNLLGTSDTVDALSNNGVRVIQNGWTLPSRHHAEFVDQANPQIEKMISGLGIKTGCIFFSGFYRNGSFAFFETGFRLSGGEFFVYHDKAGQGNVFDLYIAHALNSRLGDKLDFSTSTKLKCACVNYYAKAGRVSAINGIDEAKDAIPECILALQYGSVGQECSDSEAILSKMAMLQFVGESPDEIRRAISESNRMIRVESVQSEDMVLEYPNPISFTWSD